MRVPRFICLNKDCEGLRRTFSPRLSGIAEGARIPAAAKLAAVSAMATTAADAKSIAAHGESKFPVILVDGTTNFLIDVARSRQRRYYPHISPISRRRRGKG